MTSKAMIRHIDPTMVFGKAKKFLFRLLDHLQTKALDRYSQIKGNKKNNNNNVFFIAPQSHKKILIKSSYSMLE